MEYNSFASVIGKIAALFYMLLTVYVLYPHNCSIQDFAAASCKLSDGIFYNLFFVGVVGNLVMYLITHYYTSKIAKIRYGFDKKFCKEVILKALPYGIALVLNTVYFRIGSILLLFLKGKEFVGIYGVPLTMLEAAGIIPLYFMNAVLPVLSRSIHQKDGKHSKIIQYSFDFLLMGSFPIVIGTFLLSEVFIKLISTPEFVSNPAIGFYGSDIVLQILIIALLFSFLNSLFGYVLVANNHQEKLLYRNAIGAVITIVLSLILIPIIDVRGAALANVVTEIYMAIASYLLAKKYLDFKISFKQAWKLLFSALTMGAAVFYLNNSSLNFLTGFFPQKIQYPIKLLFIIFAAVSIYGLLLIATKTLTRDMLKMIKKQN